MVLSHPYEGFPQKIEWNLLSCIHGIVIDKNSLVLADTPGNVSTNMATRK